MDTAWSRKEARENRPTDRGLAEAGNSAQGHPVVVVDIESGRGPGVSDLFVFFAGISAIVFVWAALLLGRVVL